MQQKLEIASFWASEFTFNSIIHWLFLYFQFQLSSYSFDDGCKRGPCGRDHASLLHRRLISFSSSNFHKNMFSQNGPNIFWMNNCSPWTISKMDFVSITVSTPVQGGSFSLVYYEYSYRPIRKQRFSPSAQIWHVPGIKPVKCVTFFVGTSLHGVFYTIIKHCAKMARVIVRELYGSHVHLNPYFGNFV